MGSERNKIYQCYKGYCLNWNVGDRYSITSNSLLANIHFQYFCSIYFYLFHRKGFLDKANNITSWLKCCKWLSYNVNFDKTKYMPKWSPILVLTTVLVAVLPWSGHSLLLPSLLADVCIMHNWGILLSLFEKTKFTAHPSLKLPIFTQYKYGPNVQTVKVNGQITDHGHY